MTTLYTALLQISEMDSDSREREGREERGGGEGRKRVEKRGRREGGREGVGREGEKDGVRCYLVSFLLL